jgi:hypothetical protein
MFGQQKMEKDDRIPKAILEAILAAPGYPPSLKTLVLLERYAKNCRSTFWRRGASEVDFGSQNGAKMTTNMNRKSNKNRSLNCYDKMVARIASEVDLGGLNGAKMESKLYKKRMKNRGRISDAKNHTKKPDHPEGYTYPRTQPSPPSGSPGIP